MFSTIPLSMGMFSEPFVINDYWFEICLTADSEWEDEYKDPQFEIMEC